MRRTPIDAIAPNAHSTNVPGSGITSILSIIVTFRATSLGSVDAVAFVSLWPRRMLPPPKVTVLKSTLAKGVPSIDQLAKPPDTSIVTLRHVKAVSPASVLPVWPGNETTCAAVRD